MIHLQVGQCGNQIGNHYWQSLLNEHGIDENGNLIEERKDYKNVCFDESDSRYTPRVVLVDTDSRTTDSIQSGFLGRLFNPDQFITDSSSTGSTWASGFYSTGHELEERVGEQVRKGTERCDTLSGFQFLHSIGGGTGGGFASKILQNLRAVYTDSVVANYSLLPSPCSPLSSFLPSSHPASLLETYNAVLSLHHLIDNSDMVIGFENSSLFDMCADFEQHPHHSRHHLRPPFLSSSFDPLNRVIAGAMSNITCGFRFPCQVNGSLAKMARSLIPFPRVKFFTTTFSPLSFLTPPPSPSPSRATQQTPCATQETHAYNAMTLAEIAQGLFHPSNAVVSCDLRMGQCLTGAAFFRGNLDYGAAERQMLNLRDRYSHHFMPWIPDNTTTSVCTTPLSLSPLSPSSPSTTVPLSGTFIANSTAIGEVLKRLAEEFTTLFIKRAYIHWYTATGMDEMEFSEAESNLNDIICELTPCNSCYTCDLEEEFEDEMLDEEFG